MILRCSCGQLVGHKVIKLVTYQGIYNIRSLGRDKKLKTLVPVLMGAEQAGEQRQHHCEDGHHYQLDGDVGLPRTLVKANGPGGPNSDTVVLPALLQGCF